MYQKYTKGWQGKFLLCFATIAIIGLFLTLFEGLDYFMAFLLTGFFWNSNSYHCFISMAIRRKPIYTREK